LTSAGLLNLLAARQRALAGNPPGQQLVAQLLEAAAQPYFGILRQWLLWGVLDDPHNEFMVKVTPGWADGSITSACCLAVLCLACPSLLGHGLMSCFAQSSRWTGNCQPCL